jgi:hypothetical protein
MAGLRWFDVIFKFCFLNALRKQDTRPADLSHQPGRDLASLNQNRSAPEDNGCMFQVVVS